MRQWHVRRLFVAPKDAVAYQVLTTDQQDNLNSSMRHGATQALAGITVRGIKRMREEG
jgi:hypothetical protein